MHLPKGCDAVHLLYAVDSFLSGRHLRYAGLNRETYNKSREVQKWFYKEFVKTLHARTRRFKRDAKR